MSCTCERVGVTGAGTCASCMIEAGTATQNFSNPPQPRDDPKCEHTLCPLCSRCTKCEGHGYPCNR